MPGWSHCSLHLVDQVLPVKLALKVFKALVVRAKLPGDQQAVLHAVGPQVVGQLLGDGQPCVVLHVLTVLDVHLTRRRQKVLFKPSPRFSASLWSLFSCLFDQKLRVTQSLYFIFPPTLRFISRIDRIEFSSLQHSDDAGEPFLTVDCWQCQETESDRPLSSHKIDSWKATRVLLWMFCESQKNRMRCHS